LRFSPKAPETRADRREVGSFWSNAMNHPRHFDTSEAAQREAVKIRKMIGDLDRLARLFDCNIAIQEECVGISTERT
jgi:hypothetical protein